MSQIPRRNGWTIAAQAGDRTPDKTQRLLSRAVWDTFAAMGAVRRFAVAGLDEAAVKVGRPHGLAVGAVDETGQVKAGTRTAGVKRQYLGCAGKVANGINTVHLALVHRVARVPRRPRPGLRTAGPAHPSGSAGYWLDWRRCHQARSRWYHQRTRLARDTAIFLVS